MQLTDWWLRLLIEHIYAHREQCLCLFKHFWTHFGLGQQIVGGTELGLLLYILLVYGLIFLGVSWEVNLGGKRVQVVDFWWCRSPLLVIVRWFCVLSCACTYTEHCRKLMSALNFCMYIYSMKCIPYVKLVWWLRVSWYYKKFPKQQTYLD